MSIVKKRRIVTKNYIGCLTAPISALTPQSGKPTATNPIPVLPMATDPTTGRDISFLNMYGLPAGWNETAPIQDTYDPETQTITRKIGIYKFTGNENWQMQGTYFILQDPEFPIKSGSYAAAYCTHFSNRSYYNSSSNQGDIQIGTGTRIIYIFEKTTKPEGVTDVATWKLWLQNKAASGDPVIFYYQLATPVVEPVAPVKQILLPTHQYPSARCKVVIEGKNLWRNGLTKNTPSYTPQSTFEKNTLLNYSYLAANNGHMSWGNATAYSDSTEDGSITITDISVSYAPCRFLVLKPSTTYTLSSSDELYAVTKYMPNTDGKYVFNKIILSKGNIRSFTTESDEDAIYGIIIYPAVLNVSTTITGIQVEEGSTATSFEVYYKTEKEIENKFYLTATTKEEVND